LISSKDVYIFESVHLLNINMSVYLLYLRL